MVTEKINHTHPLFIQSLDIPALVLVSIQLTGSENYGLWSRSMKLALKAKRKLGFIIGDCKKEMLEDDLHEEHETCKAIVHSWIMNSVSKDLVNGIIYAFDVHVVWEDLKERFDKFLNELNDIYDQAGRQILIKTNKPTLNQAHALNSQDESQQAMGNLLVTEKLDPLAMQAGRGKGYCGKKIVL
ncbi:uncharacterized protein LOC142180889 [Nicotiana tabacum]|uniref:Uncharacterized protein LOC142180889 n=1 Tax=Nicotiana tabacum TaxID=4097 RepID=A0AC58UHX7_TOBAC